MDVECSDLFQWVFAGVEGYVFLLLIFVALKLYSLGLNV